MQSYDYGQQLHNQHTILNLYSGFVGIGTEFPQMKLHVKHQVGADDENPVIIPNRALPDSAVITQTVEELDADILEKERTGSMRLETEVIEGASSVWDFHPSAGIEPDAIENRLYFTSANQNQTVMTLVSNGFVGIGTLRPLQKLHVYNGNILVSGSHGNTGSILFNKGSGGSSNWGNYGIEYIQPGTVNSNKGGLNFWRPWGNVANGLTENFVLHLANDGNVGIGTGIPVAKLHVNLVAEEDWAYGIKLDVNRDTLKAFSVYNNFVNEDVFMIWGNGVVNTKTLYAEAVKVRPTTNGIYWPDFVFD